ncbi:MAG: nitrate/nitrite transporter [Actinoallomurus sp.]
MAPTDPTTTPPEGLSLDRLWRRGLDRYPDTAARYRYLAVAVFVTIVLYYELYVAGGVAPLMLAHFKMSFLYYVNVLVLSNLVGAFGSLAAGIADRWGRANLVTYGLLGTGVLAILTPLAPNKPTFGVFVILSGLVEGMCLVATPALVRDFSPQIGRASAMGFWTLGPVIGSLVVSFVANRTLPHFDDSWSSQYYIVGVVGLVAFAVALFGLRELRPGLRDQVMISMADRALVEARADTAEREADLRHPWRQMMRLDVLAPALGVSVFLLIYYTAVAFFTIYLTSNFGLTTARANGVNSWYWAMNAVSLVIVGVVSDRLRVRKPFMVGGTLLAVVMTFLFMTRTTHPHTSSSTLIWIISLLAVGLGVAYTPWMAAFTETVERRNPALTATGLAVWGWILRIVVCVSYFVLPYVVGAVDTLTRAPEVLAAAKKVPPGTPPPPALLHELGQLKKAAADAPHQWQAWWWICIVAELLFLVLMLPLVGRWSPRAARADADAHEREVARLTGSQG